MRARFYLLKKLVDKEGAAPIYINIHHRSHRLRYYTGERIKEGDWDKVKQRGKSSYIGYESLNDLLDVLAEEPKKIERNARISGIDCSIEYLKERLSYNKSRPGNFIEIMEEFIKLESQRHSWTNGTEKRWRYVKNNLDKFDKKYKLEFDSINDNFAQAFIKHHVKEGWGNATIKKHIGCVIQFTKWARKKGYHTASAYRGNRSPKPMLSI